MSQSKKYREVYELYQLCSTGKDLKEFCIDAGVNYNKFTEWQRKQHWNAKLGRMEEVQLPVMSAVTLTDVPEKVFAETKNIRSVSPVIRSASLELEDGTSVVVSNTTYDKVLQVFQKLIG